jgi:hypothetical protein
MCFDHSQLMAIARSQEGLWSRAQTLETGASYRVIRSRVAAGVWIDHGHGVLGAPSAPATHRRQLWRAHLAAGPTSVISHQAAAVVYGFRGFGGEPVVLTRPHSSSVRLAGVVVHQIDDCTRHHRTSVGSLPVTTIDRTLLDLAAVCGRARLSLAVEAEVSRARSSIASLAGVLAEVARPGKPGVRRLSRVLDEQIGTRPGASALERSMQSLLDELDVPFGYEVRLPGRDEVTGVVDFVLPQHRLIVEVDGRRWHERRHDMVRDRERDNAAAAAGWQTLRFMWEHVVGDRDGTLATLHAICEARRRQLDVKG